jgi:hypothetical protein
LEDWEYGNLGIWNLASGPDSPVPRFPDPPIRRSPDSLIP